MAMRKVARVLWSLHAAFAEVRSELELRSIAALLTPLWRIDIWTLSHAPPLKLSPDTRAALVARVSTTRRA